MKQRRNPRSSFVEHPRKELTLTNRLNASAISSLSTLKASAPTAVSKVILQRSHSRKSGATL
ncbi:hypothetical protein N7489_003657 [Penicillium chrysogenum]|uniref:uncharacterized protein n=1 Tax=Penicillium chrysogenum TaxID=5076 RepID=UPI00238E9765|nr:uncharacterized protein N7489_003657 [Penicillium chrysogenum]KAJ5243561.1 hypothetical protein N7489_003657 [Penicillium chrysogenum]KAJ5257331.1 hypothetical protein N7524_008887 [Penicillium chrysogenum]KAJ6140626.1 hypothetical protein N7497_011519 [Penicillium chrysogenum]